MKTPVATTRNSIQQQTQNGVIEVLLARERIISEQRQRALEKLTTDGTPCRCGSAKKGHYRPSAAPILEENKQQASVIQTQRENIVRLRTELGAAHSELKDNLAKDSVLQRHILNLGHKVLALSRDFPESFVLSEILAQLENGDITSDIMLQTVETFVAIIPDIFHHEIAKAARNENEKLEATITEANMSFRREHDAHVITRSILDSEREKFQTFRKNWESALAQQGKRLKEAHDEIHSLESKLEGYQESSVTAENRAQIVGSLADKLSMELDRVTKERDEVKEQLRQAEIKLAKAEGEPKETQTDECLLANIGIQVPEAVKSILRSDAVQKCVRFISPPRRLFSINDSSSSSSSDEDEEEVQREPNNEEAPATPLWDWISKLWLQHTVHAVHRRESSAPPRIHYVIREDPRVANLHAEDWPAEPHSMTPHNRLEELIREATPLKKEETVPKTIVSKAAPKRRTTAKPKETKTAMVVPIAPASPPASNPAPLRRSQRIRSASEKSTEGEVTAKSSKKKPPPVPKRGRKR